MTGRMHPQEGRRQLVDVAMGRRPADAVINGGVLVNVNTAQQYRADVAISGQRIAAVGDIAHTVGPATRVIDAGGRYLTPGLIDTHIHSYHSYLGIREYVEGMLRHGVTAVADGFYGQAIVSGMDAIHWSKEVFDRMPIRLLFVAPVMAYIQNRELGLTPVKAITVEDMFEMLSWDDCLGVEEPPYLVLEHGFDEIYNVFEETLRQRKVITGHAAGLTDRQLDAYIAMGAATDHEAVDAAEAVARARAGMRVLVRGGSGCNDLPAVLPAFLEDGIDPRSISFSTDVLSAEKLIGGGGIHQMVRDAIAAGVPPVTAVQMATLNGAEVFNLQLELGSISPGRLADILLVDHLERFDISGVLVGGVERVRDDRLVEPLPPVEYPTAFRSTVRLETPVGGEDLLARVPASETTTARVIGVTDGSLFTRERHIALPSSDGVLRGSIEQDVLPMAMIDRHGKGTGIGHALVQGIGLRRGAIASSVNAVCENLVVVGVNENDMALAVNKLAEIGGGKIVVADGDVLALVELPVFGLLSDAPLDVVMGKFDAAFAAIRVLGCELDSPFSTLEFCCACGEIGDLRLSEEGLVDVPGARRVDLVVSS
jgi:adenine deaminase